MRRFILLLVTLALASCVQDAITPTGPEPSGPLFSSAQDLSIQPGRVVARFAPGAPAAAIAAGVGGTVLRDMALGMRLLAVPPGREGEVIQALRRSPGVLFAEPSYPRVVGLPCAAPDGDCSVPSDALLGRRWDLHNDGFVRSSSGGVLAPTGAVDADMDWLEAFDRLGAFTGSAVLGVVDTGIFGAHEDLTGRLVAQHDFFYVDGVANDDNGHGTHVSGIGVAYADNAKGAAGVAYGPNVKLVVAKGCGYALPNWYICWSPDVADGIAWAADRANVINLSLGGTEPSEAERAALQYAASRNVLPVCAAGNESGAVIYPAAFPECMAVSATNWQDRRASYSNAGPEVEVSAPGGDGQHASGYDMIASSWNDGGYRYAAGTSMASPQVAGLATLLHALGVTSASAKRALIRSTSDDLGVAGVDWVYGSGRINVYRAINAVLGDPEPPPPPPPNQAPVAAFTFSCTDLACAFTDASTDDAGVTGWAWDFGDASGSGEQSPSHSYAAGGSYTVSLTVTDAGGLSDQASQSVTVVEPPPPPPPPPPALVLTGVPSKLKGYNVVTLSWEGAATEQVSLYRNGALLTTLNATPSTYQDATGTKGKATWVYRVCEVGTERCSDPVTVVF